MQFIDSFKKNKSVFVLISMKRVSFYSETVTQSKD